MRLPEYDYDTRDQEPEVYMEFTVKRINDLSGKQAREILLEMVGDGSIKNLDRVNHAINKVAGKSFE